MMMSRLKRASARFSGRGSSDGADGPSNNAVVRYEGVSMRFMQRLMQDVLEEKAAQGVELVVVTEETLVETLEGRKVCVGPDTTVRVVRKGKENSLRCTAPFLGEFELARDALVAVKTREEWTIEDVCEYVVLRETCSTKSFYLDRIDSKDVGERFRGAFISQARKSRFVDLVEALLTHYENQDLGKQFVWVDLFSANQPLLTARDETLSEQVLQNRAELLKVGLHDAIREFDERLVFFNSWLNPYPIERAWCVWEIFGCVKSNQSLDILFRPGEERDFIDILLEDRGRVTTRIMDLRLENAKCFDPKDKEDIDDAVREQVGYHTLNVTISSLVINWLGAFLTKVINEKRRDEGSTALLASILYEAGMFLQYQLGAYEEALMMLQDALDIGIQVHGGVDNVEVARTLHELARVLQKKGELDTAYERYLEVLQIEEKLYKGRDHPNVATTIHCIANVLQEKGDYKAALIQYEEALRIYEKAYHGREHANVASTLHEMGTLFLDSENLKEALKHYRQALEIEEKVYRGRDHPNVAKTLHEIARVLQNQGEFDAALEQLEEVLRIEERAYGGHGHRNIAKTLHEIARVLQNKGEFDAALDQYHEVLRIKEKTYGTREHPDVATTLHEMARVLQNMGDLEGAEKFYEEVLQIEKKTFGDGDHPNIAITLCCIGSVLHAKGEFVTAIGQYQKALAIIRKGNDEKHAAVILGQIAGVLRDKGDYTEALQTYQRIVRIFEEHGDKSNKAVAMHGVATVLKDMGQFEKALREFRAVLSILEKLYGKRNHPDVAETLIGSAICLCFLDRLDECQSTLEQVSHDSSETQALLLFAKGILYRLTGDLRLSKRALENSLAHQTTRNSSDPQLQATKFELAQTLQALNKLKEATTLLQHLLNTRKSIFPANHIRILEITALLP